MANSTQWKEICNSCPSPHVVLLPDDQLSCLKCGRTWQREPRMAKTCPVCHGEAIQKLQGGIRRCESCGHMW